jgi:hypothetical protein
MAIGIECARMRGAVADESQEAGSCLLRLSAPRSHHELATCYSGLDIKQPTQGTKRTSIALVQVGQKGAIGCIYVSHVTWERSTKFQGTMLRYGVLFGGMSMVCSP